MNLMIKLFIIINVFHELRFLNVNEGYHLSLDDSLHYYLVIKIINYVVLQIDRC